MNRVKCPNCGAIIEYEYKSVVEGNRDFEEIDCPDCCTKLARVFTDDVPRVYVIKHASGT